MTLALVDQVKSSKSVMESMINRFFAFEGVDGCGKSTQIELLHTFLEKKGYSVVRIREPGGTKFSEEIREVLLKPRENTLNSMAELLLFNASRAQLVEEVIKPAMAEGKVILADRFFLSTLAYQGYGRELDVDFISGLLKVVCGSSLPAKTFLLDLSAEDSEKRRLSRNEDADRMELEKKAFFDRVVEGYRQSVKNESFRISKYNANESIDIIHRQIAEEVVTILESDPKEN